MGWARLLAVRRTHVQFVRKCAMGGRSPLRVLTPRRTENLGIFGVVMDSHGAMLLKDYPTDVQKNGGLAGRGGSGEPNVYGSSFVSTLLCDSIDAVDVKYFDRFFDACCSTRRLFRRNTILSGCCCQSQVNARAPDKSHY